MLLSTCCSRRLFALPLASPSGPMRSITAVTLFLFTVLGATASHATYTWTSHDYPSATSTSLLGIDGPNMVGTYTDSSGVHGTLYNGSTWATLDYPSATATTLTGIDGANMVGWYQDSSGIHGFMVTATSPVPEPATLLLALFGLALLPHRRRR